MRVIYIAGWMRSGTTLLAQMAGALEGAVCLGELSGVWRAARLGHRCSCGHPLDECCLWGHVLSTIRDEEGWQTSEWDQLAKLFQTTMRTRHAKQLASLHPDRPAEWPADVARCVHLLSTIAREVQTRTGAVAIVDSSKLAPGFLLWRLVPEVDLHVVHIIRDPRAVACSERRSLEVDQPAGDGPPPGRTLLKSAAYWAIFNVAIRWWSGRLCSYQTLTYEGLTAAPLETLNNVGCMVGLGHDGRTIIRPGHTAVGNPARFGGAGRSIQPDLRWKRELSRRSQGLILATTAPARALLAATADLRTTSRAAIQPRTR